jgi:hypothetical protein
MGLLMCPWLGFAHEFYDILSRRDDVEAGDLDTFWDRCVQKWRKDGSLERMGALHADIHAHDVAPDAPQSDVQKAKNYNYSQITAATYMDRCLSLYIQPSSRVGYLRANYGETELGTIRELIDSAKNCIALCPTPDAYGLMGYGLFLRGEYQQALDW